MADRPRIVFVSLLGVGVFLAAVSSEESRVAVYLSSGISGKNLKAFPPMDG